MRKSYKRWGQQETEFLSENFDTMRFADIAKHLGRSKQSVKEKSRLMGLVVDQSGERNAASKLTDIDKVIIGKLSDAGLTCNEIYGFAARVKKVRQTTVLEIIQDYSL